MMNAALDRDGSKSYKSYISRRIDQSPCLRNLSNFLNDRSTSKHDCRIACQKLPAESGAPRRLNVRHDDLQLLLQSNVRNEDIQGRLLVIEDLSPKIIEILGSLLNIDPLFFAVHLDVHRPTMASTRPSMALLPSRAQSQDFLNLHYHRVLEHSENPASSRSLLRDMNIERKVVILPQVQGVHVGLVRHCCSVLKTTGQDGLWLGMLC